MCKAECDRVFISMSDYRSWWERNFKFSNKKKQTHSASSEYKTPFYEQALYSKSEVCRKNKEYMHGNVSLCQTHTFFKHYMQMLGKFL